MPRITRNYYSVESLRRELDAFEERYGISTETFVELHRRDEDPDHVSGFDAHVWANTYVEMKHLEENGEDR